MKQKLFALFGLIFCLTFAFSQTKFSGKVTDKETGETLPFVTIQTQPGAGGATTDLAGNFTVSSTTAIKALVFNFIGYETFTYKTQGYNENNLNIQLKPTGIQIEETVVKVKRKKMKIPKDTAAVSLQQLIVDNKDNNRPKSFSSYHFKEHTKIEFDYYNFKDKLTQLKILKPLSVAFDYIDTTENEVKYLPMLLQEKLSEHYYNQNPQKEKIKDLGQYMTGVQNVSAMVILDDIFENFDLYDNIIIAGGKSFTSPFSTTGLLTYRYYLTDTITENGKDYYQLSFYPKSQESISFLGYSLIDPKTYAIKYIEFKVPEKANLNFVSEFVVSQSFEEVEPSKWMLKAEFIQIALNPISRKKGRQIMVRKNMERGEIEVNKNYPDSIFEGEKQEVADSLKNRTRDWWTENRVQALNETEAGILTMSDSIERTGMYKTLKWFGHLGSTAFLKAGPVEFGRFYQFVSWNNVEGIRPKLGLRTNEDFHENLQLWGYLAYGIKDKQFKSFANVRVMLPRENRKWHVLELNYKKDFTFLGQDYEDQQFAHDNIFLALLRRGPLEKIIMMENFTLTYEREWVKGYTTQIKLGPKAFYAVPGVFDFEKNNTDGTTEFVEKINVAEISINQHFGFGQTFYENKYYRFPGFSKKPVIDLDYTVALKNILGSDYNYHKLELKYYHRLSSKIGYTLLNANAGKIFGKLPYTLMFIPMANQSFYFNVRAYQLMNEFEFVADEYASLWVEHHFDGAIFNKIPGINKLKLRSLISAKGLIGNAKKANINEFKLPAEMSTLENWYVEVGFGIENILQMLRFDFYWRLTQRDKPGVQKFGVKFAVTPKL
ncbi:MAG: DUF5686 family protein [Chitinophagales bacterium]